MAKKDLKAALFAKLDDAYKSGPLADAAAQMSGLSPAPITAMVNASALAAEEQTAQPARQHSEQHSEQLGEQLGEYSVGRPKGHPTEQLIGQPDEQHKKQHNEHVGKQGNRQLSGQDVKQHAGQLTGYPWALLTRNQDQVLRFLCERGGGFTNMQVLCGETGIPYGTARNAIAILEKCGYVTNKKAHKEHAFHGFIYTINEQLCAAYQMQQNGQLNEQLTQQLGRQHVGQLTGQLIGYPYLPLTRAFPKVLEEGKDLNLTSSKQAIAGHLDGQPDQHLTEHPAVRPQAQSEILSDPEHLYWKDLGLNEKKVASWMKETGMDAAEMDLSLRYARFSFLKDPGKVKSPMDLFYTIIKREGCFTPPVGYKSLKQIRLDRAVAELERKRQEDLQEEKLERDLAFDRIFQDKQSAEYLNLKAQVVTPGGLPLSGKMLESAMREAFISSMPPS